MATGIGAMCVVMLDLPLTSVMVATILLFSDGVAVMPLVIVAVVVAYVAAARITPAEPAQAGPAQPEMGSAVQAGPAVAADPSVTPRS